MAATEALLQGATQVSSTLAANHTGGTLAFTLAADLLDHAGVAIPVPFEVLVGRNRPASERRYFLVTSMLGGLLGVAASPGYTDNQNFVIGDTIDVISAWETQRRLRAFATLHTHTGGLDGSALAAITLANLPVVPDCHVTHNANQSLLNDTETALAFNTETTDTEAMHDTATNNNRITIVTAGLYELRCGVWYESNATGYRQVRIRKNGATYLGTINIPATSGNVTAIAFPCRARLSAADYVEALGRQTSGGALNALSSAEVPWFSATYLGK